MEYIKRYLVAGLLFTAVLGILMHFFYEWSGGSPIVGLVSPVNESAWEHMKLIFFPVLFWSLLMPSRISSEAPALRPALLAGGLLGTLLVPVLFYTYSGILGYDVTWVDIGIFFIGILTAFACAWILRSSEKTEQKRTAVYFLTVLFIILFFLFTFLPPDIGLFAEP